jgi:hypothetical protein
VYSSRDMFMLDAKFTEDEIKEFSKICNTHWDDRFNSINALALELILNNCHPDMFRKITVQLEGVSEVERGGALALFYIRRAVVRASQENSETIKTALKNLKIKDLTAENVDDAVRIIRNAHATLKAANSVPTKFYLQLFDTMQTTSNIEFNMIFEHWKRKAIVADKEVAIDTILNRATDVYQSHLDKKTWLSNVQTVRRSHTYYRQTDLIESSLRSFSVLVSLPIRNHNINSYQFTPPPQDFIFVLLLA